MWGGAADVLSTLLLSECPNPTYNLSPISHLHFGSRGLLASDCSLTWLGHAACSTHQTDQRGAHTLVQRTVAWHTAEGVEGG
jgi:hypothetical protein